MLYDRLSANILAKPIEDRVSPKENLETPKRRLRKDFDAVGNEAKVGLEWQDHDWPEPDLIAPNGRVITDEQGKYRDLYSHTFNSDINVILVRNLDELGPELGHLLIRSKSALHTFLVTLEKLPLRASSDSYRGLTCVPLPDEKQNYHLHTEAEKAGVFSKKNPEQRGLMSFHAYEKLSHFRIQNLLALAYMRKTS